MNNKLASHGQGKPVKDLIEFLEKKPPSCGTERAVEIVQELMKFEWGRFLIENRGLNGAWTSYLVLHPEKGRLSGLNREGQPFSDLESWLLNRCPVSIATQERFRIFQQLTQQNLQPFMQLASIPCGLMDDLLSLDYSGLKRVEVTGIDLDEASLKAAEINYNLHKPPISARFEQHDAWDLNFPEHWDFITSNGLNVYIQDDSKVVQLYRNFCKSLKPGGHLLISFLTPPVFSNSRKLWKVFDEDDLKFQTVLFSEILQIKWQYFRTEEQTIAQLKEAGFEVETVSYDKQRLFPTVLARKAK